MSRSLIVLLATIIFGCATLSKEEIAACKGNDECIAYTIADKKILRREKAEAHYRNLQGTCPNGSSVVITCDVVGSGCGRFRRRNSLPRYSTWELMSARCGSF